MVKFILLIALFFLSSYLCFAQDNVIVAKTGDWVQIAVPASAYLTTFLRDDSDGGNQFLGSFVANLCVVYALKFAINKPRPEGKDGMAFPSGHTAAAFHGATFLARRYGYKYGIPAFVAAAFVGMSRLKGFANRHDGYDVAGGAAVGILMGILTTEPFDGGVVSGYVGRNNSFGINLSMSL